MIINRNIIKGTSCSQKHGYLKHGKSLRFYVDTYTSPKKENRTLGNNSNKTMKPEKKLFLKRILGRGIININ